MSDSNLSRAEWQRVSPQPGEDESSVEIAIVDGHDVPVGHKGGEEQVVLMRDAKRPEGPVLVFTPAEWEAFVEGVKDGEFDLDTFPPADDIHDGEAADDVDER